MGTTPKPLVMVALPPVDTWPEVAALAAQGHTIMTLEQYRCCCGEAPEVDVFLGPTCWRMDELHRKYLKLAVEEARRARYPAKGKKSA